jgi:hypothetical protein
MNGITAISEMRRHNGDHGGTPLECGVRMMKWEIQRPAKAGCGSLKARFRTQICP